MNHNRNASVALLMLDIASAKSSLAQLQQTFDTATAEHQRTLGELHELKVECDVPPVYADGATVGDKAMSRQLQALHIENLQLQSLLKQEIEARQQLQHQHAALLGVLRSCGMQDILNVPLCATTSAHCAPVDATTSFKALGGAGHVPALGQHEAPTVQQHRGTGRQAVYTMPATARVTGTMHDSIGPEYASKADSTGTNTAAAVAESHTSSAYFPAQQQRCRAKGKPAAYQQQSPADCSKAWSPQAQQQQDCKDLYAAVAAIDAQCGQHSNLHDSLQSCNDSQHSSQPSSLNTGQQQQQQQHATVPAGRTSVINSPERDQQVDSEGAELSASESLSSCTQSAASELLDSDDLEELAGLCDGLISQASRQRLVYAAMHDSAAADAGSPAGRNAWRAEQAAGAVGTTCGEHNQQTTAYPSWVQDAMQGAQQHHYAQQPAQQQQASKQQASKQPLDRHDDFGPARAQHGGVIEIPDIEVLAAELNRLQQQVAAAGIDTGPTAAAVRAALGAASNAATSFRAFNASAGSGAQSSTTTSTIGSNTTSSRSAETRRPAAVQASSSSGMADLQQQLAARMAEVKERLSSVCNGMLEEALGTGGASARSPSTAETAATTAGQGYADFHPHLDQAQQDGPASAADAARPEPRSWSSSISSSSSARTAGALKPQTSALSSQADTTAIKAPPSVAFEVHADGHANSYVAPAAPTDVAAGNKPRSGLKHPPTRVRVGGPAFWSGSRGAAGTAADGWTQAGLDNRRASNYAPHQVASKRVPAATGSRDSSDTLKEEAPAGSSSESSWDTADEEEAEQQEQHHPPTHQHQQARQQGQGLQEQWRQFASASGENLHPDAFQTPPKQPQQHVEQQTRQQQYADLENTDRSDWPRQQWQQPNMYTTPTKHQLQEPVTGVSGNQQTGSWGPSPHGEDPGFDAASNSGRLYPNVPGQWQQRQQRGGMTDGLEGVLFGLKGRVAAEVSQTASPLKVGTAAGGTYTSRSPVTPLKPRNA